MGKKSVDDYLNDGIYGSRRPKERERMEFLGTLKERIVIALTVGQVMTDSGIKQLDMAMEEHKDTTLLINGQVAYRFLAEEKKVANKHGIPYTVITNEEFETNIGAVLTYDYAINKDNIFISDEPEEEKEEVAEDDRKSTTFFSKLKQWISPKS